ALPELWNVTSNARTGSARFRAQVTELVPPVPETEAIIAWWKGGRISFPEFSLGRAFPLPRERVRMRGKPR
ncbi:MAG: hypothetical protein CMF73_05155, partial [Maricaulis sp.]|nr:hypothetical protein [Maricaulis sp.]